jgi:hypothetical protein
MYNVPGKLASVGGIHRDPTKASTLFVFASPELYYDRRDLEQQKKLLADAYAGVGWEVPTLLEALWDAHELYFDSISRVDLQPWSAGRVALVGDAACGATLGGWAPAPRWSPPMFWPVSSPPPAATTAPRSLATNRRSAATSKALRKAATRPGSSWPHARCWAHSCATGCSGTACR